MESGPDICNNLGAALGREWLETNGLGGFASSTIVGLNARRYQALLVAALRPPVERYVLLSKFEETLTLGGRRMDLSANQYPGVIHPQGHVYLKRFRLDPFPLFTYVVDGVEIEKSVLMIYGENSTVIEYRVQAPPGAPQDLWLELRPLIAFRDYHNTTTTHENGALERRVRTGPGLASVAPYGGLPALYFAHDAQQLDPSGDWYRNFEYQVERERGLDYLEDLYNPFTLRVDLRTRRSAAVIASTEKRDAARAGEYLRAEVERRRAVLAASPSKDPLVLDLVAAADQYIVSRGDQKTIPADYPWFSDWGRETMVALPGLTLVTGRYDVARSILVAFARHVDRGMLPNRFADAGEKPEYNTVDATLWFFEAVRAFLAYTGDWEFVRANLYEVLCDIMLLAPQRDALRDRGERRRVAERWRARRAAHLDGRQGGRLGGDAARARPPGGGGGGTRAAHPLRRLLCPGLERGRAAVRSDYPHQIGSLPLMLDSIRALSISEQDKANILGNNAARLLKLRDGVAG